MWRLEYSEKARKQLYKLDPASRAIILGWMSKNIDSCENPRVHGKGLSSNRSGEWRYRIGDYRVLCELQDARVTVLAFNIGHRSGVYKR
ncbi:MAG: type II toxin-antitoxin system RelE/ParE family toxin [Oscillospiraceae bacterium]|jgi:mRNA interferase RelE/StbE|nr:type II toxin-antitoxin system RelE/ParE family toxin [Oscillospiraceae bacterium]